MAGKGITAQEANVGIDWLSPWYLPITCTDARQGQVLKGKQKAAARKLVSSRRQHANAAQTDGQDSGKNKHHSPEIYQRVSTLGSECASLADNAALPAARLSNQDPQEIYQHCPYQCLWERPRPVPSDLTTQAATAPHHNLTKANWTIHCLQHQESAASIAPVEYPDLRSSIACLPAVSTGDWLADPKIGTCTTSVQRLEQQQQLGNPLQYQHPCHGKFEILGHRIGNSCQKQAECRTIFRQNTDNYSLADINERDFVDGHARQALGNVPRQSTGTEGTIGNYHREHRPQSSPIAQAERSGLPFSISNFGPFDRKSSSFTRNHNAGILRSHHIHGVPAAGQNPIYGNLNNLNANNHITTPPAKHLDTSDCFDYSLLNTGINPLSNQSQLLLLGQANCWSHLSGWSTSCGSSDGAAALPCVSTNAEHTRQEFPGRPQIDLARKMAGHFDSHDDELARLQELSNSWQPDASGPLVSQCLPSSTLTEEYASADPVYQIKTATLQHKYAQYRTCRGDGHCGWRAIAFSYFEVLQRIGDKQKFTEEEQRFLALEPLIQQTGLQRHIYEDFMEDTIDLLRETSVANDGGASLLQAFNDEGRSQSIITFFKMLTSTWLRTHADEYQPYLDRPLEEYCRMRIDPAVTELEHVGLTALVDLLIKPAGIGAEVLYLDRNAGEEVASYTYEPLDHSGKVISHHPWFRLLYRPGHYDILYKAEDLASTSPRKPSSAAQDILVGFTSGQSIQLDHPAPLGFVGNDYEIPGMGYFPSQQGAAKSWGPLDAHLNYRSVQPHSPPPPLVQTKSLPLRPSDHAPNYSPATAYPDYTRAPESSSHVVSPTSPLSPGFGPPVIDASRFRPSKFEFERDYNAQNAGTQVYQTPIFKNSHFNLAHFNNPEFTPEQWDPEVEYREIKRKRPSQ